MAHALWTTAEGIQTADDACKAKFGPRGVGQPVENLEAMGRLLGMEPLGGNRWTLGEEVYQLEDVQLGTQRLLTLSDLHSAHARFLRIAAHDLRGPLANIRSYAALMQSPRFQMDERTRKGVDVILRNADKSLDLSSSLLDLWKCEHGALVLEREPTPVLPLLSGAAESLLQRPLPAGVALEVLEGAGIEATLPNVLVDPDRMRGAFKALLAHGISRSPPSTVVLAQARASGNGVWVTVVDDGPPLLREEAEHAFDPDYVVPRARKLDAQFDLCVAGALVHAHGGVCDAHTAEDHRSHFSFWLPSSASLPRSEAEPALHG